MNREDQARAHIVHLALKWNGWGNGSGYPGKSPNPACHYMGIGTTYSCACGVSMNFGHAGYPLISMQAGYAHGYTYCPSGLATVREKQAGKHSWHAKPADILFINTGGGSQPGHTEMVAHIFGSGAGRIVRSIGWDSGPSNVDHYTGQGGVHLHDWHCPDGHGNPAIMGVGDAAKLSPRLAAIAGHKHVQHTGARKGIHHAPSGHGGHPARRPLTKDQTSKITQLSGQLEHLHLPVVPGHHGIRELRKLDSRIHSVLRHVAH